MVGDQDADAALTKVGDDFLYVGDGDGIDACKRLVEQDELRLDGEAARDLDAAALAARQLRAEAVAHMADVELREKLLHLRPLFRTRQSRHLKNREEVLLDGHLAEDRGFLREVADAKPRALVHRHRRDAHVGNEDVARRRLLKPRDHVERRRLARAIGTQQSDDLALVDAQGDMVDDAAPLECLDQVLRFQIQSPSPLFLLKPQASSPSILQQEFPCWQGKPSDDGS